MIHILIQMEIPAELTTPVIDASSVSSLRLKFYYKNPTGGNFEVYVSTNGGSTYTLVRIWFNWL